ncbi:MAG: succinate dehydrogenase, cytochrome b556 subunit [Alphaproteobacteria bacterium]
MTSADRPLSPHLQVYRPQLTSVLSILHRATGIVLVLGLVLLVAWLMAAAQGPDPFALAQELAGGWFGRLVLFGFTFCLFYHLANGIRHLAWDAGLGFALETAYATGWTVVSAAVVLTLLAWVAGYSAMGAL